ncbi:hypothetical protein CHISP_0702 [Chitinispirillum alkaliphilum]|nr:hypothetical protein CHISP_0702 [Chitinispirillum alkaliphilum]
MFEKAKNHTPKDLKRYEKKPFQTSAENLPEEKNSTPKGSGKPRTLTQFILKNKTKNPSSPVALSSGKLKQKPKQVMSEKSARLIAMALKSMLND